MIHAATFYSVNCDRCDEAVLEPEYENTMYAPSPAEIVDWAQGYEVESRWLIERGGLVVCDECLRAFSKHIGAMDDDHSDAGWLWDAVHDMTHRHGGAAAQWAEAVLRAWMWRSA